MGRGQAREATAPSPSFTAWGRESQLLTLGILASGLQIPSSIIVDHISDCFQYEHSLAIAQYCRVHGAHPSTLSHI